MSDLALSVESPSRSPLATEVARRRTFAIISHPDAGKTTLTEKLLLFGGAINLAGQVKAKGERRNTRSDWMKIERERGISVVTSVMTFEYDGRVFNLLDTPGHEDFSEDTYRTLTAVDSAVMVIDAARGIDNIVRRFAARLINHECAIQRHGLRFSLHGLCRTGFSLSAFSPCRK